MVNILGFVLNLIYNNSKVTALDIVFICSYILTELLTRLTKCYNSIKSHLIYLY